MKSITCIKKIILLCVSLTVLFSCQEEHLQEGPQSVQFSISNNLLSKAARVANVDDVSDIIITVKKTTGEAVLQSEKVALYEVKGRFISEPVSFSPGDYVLTDLLVVDDTNNVLYLAPKEGSEKAPEVPDPLPIPFKVPVGDLLKIAVTVLPAENDPQIYGYISYEMNLIETVEFKVQAYITKDGSGVISGWEDPNLERTQAKIEITRPVTSASVYSGLISPDSEAIELVRQPFLIRIRVSKEGYLNFEYNLSFDELAQHWGDPIKVLLKPMHEPFRFIAQSTDDIKAVFIPSGDPDKLLFTTTKGLWKINIADIQNPSSPVFIGEFTGDFIAEDLDGTLFLGNYYSNDLGETWNAILNIRPTSNFVALNGIQFGLRGKSLYKETSENQWEFIRDFLYEGLIEYNNRLFASRGGLVSDDGITFVEIPADEPQITGMFKAQNKLFLKYEPTGGYIREWTGTGWSWPGSYEYDAEQEGVPLFAGQYDGRMALVEYNTVKVFNHCGTEMCDPVLSATFHWNPSQLPPSNVFGRFIRGSKLILQTRPDASGTTWLYALDLSKYNLNQ